MDQVQAYVENDRINLANLAALTITVLDTAFGNPNRVAKAEAKLSVIQPLTTLSFSVMPPTYNGTK